MTTSLEDRISSIERTVTSKLEKLTSPKPSGEYNLYKEEALAVGIPPQVYEAAIWFAVESSDFIRDLRQYNFDHFSGIIGDKFRKAVEELGLDLALQELNHCQYGYDQSSREYDDYITSCALPLRSFGSECHSYSARKEEWKGMVDTAQQKANRIRQAVENSSDVRNWKEKERYFEALPFEYKNPEKIVEDEELRVKALDAVRFFHIDYRNVLINSLIATDNDFGNVMSGIVDRLVKTSYVPAVNYRASLERLEK